MSASNLDIDFWNGLQGSWQLNRKLTSTNASEPSGKCTGTATFSDREPSVFIDGDGKLQTAVREMLYSEQGEFEMSSTSAIGDIPRFPFSRRYVWRLQEPKSTSSSSRISIWFVKPGTEEIDYLFHEVELNLPSLPSQSTIDIAPVIVEAEGGHLCVEDFYSSSYTFELRKNEATKVRLVHKWNMLHEVRGPKKDQVIETCFTRF